MRLLELLMETPQEDKVLIQLAKLINSSLPVPNKRNKKPVKVGSLQKFVNQLPLASKQVLGDRFKEINLELHNASDIDAYVAGGNTNSIKKDFENTSNQAYWTPGGNSNERSDVATGTIVLGKEQIGEVGTNSVLAHELRHALDDSKSRMATADSSRYNTPRKKEHQGNEFSYIAQPAEINARFVQAMDSVARAIPIIYKLPPEKIRPRIKMAIGQALQNHRISGLFPEKEQSREYKQLMKRAMQFVQNEMIEHEGVLKKQGRPKQAIGNW